MGKFYAGFENISVKLLNFTGNDLARQVVSFGNLGETYEGCEYNENDPTSISIVDDVINGYTFPKYALEGHSVAFQVNNISRVCLAQFTRDQGFFCSASGGVRPLTQEFVTPLSIYENKEWMSELEDIQSRIEKLYVKMCEAGIPYLDTRYFGFHAQTISCCYTANISQFLRSCNTRTENGFSDECNYIFRLMLFELKKAINEQVTDKNSLRLWKWLLEKADNKTWYKRGGHYNNDFNRFPTPEGHVFPEPAHNDWTKSGWKKELEWMADNRPELLFPGEAEMIMKWRIEERVHDVHTTHDPNYYKAPGPAIKNMYYYKEAKK